MSVNQKRAKEFQQTIRDLQESLSFEEYNKVIQAKIIDFITRSGDFRDMTKQDLRRLIGNFFHPEYMKYNMQTESKILEGIDIVNALYDDIGPQVEQNWQTLLATEEVVRAKIGQYEKKAIEHYTYIMRKAARDALPVDEVAKRIADAGGKVEFYADTLARTGVKGIARTAKAEKARLGEVFWQQYVGIIRPETRPFCEAMKGQTRHVNTIRQMRNGQIEPVLHYCGGFNCHHDWEPDPFYKPPEDWQKKIRWQEMSIGKRRIKYTLRG